MVKNVSDREIVSQRGIFGICVREAADHDYRDFLVKSPQLADKLYSVHIRHQMVRDDHTDFCLPGVAAQQRQGALSLGGDMAFNLGFAQHQLTHRELCNIVVQQKGLFHAGYALLSLRYLARTSTSARAQSSS